MDFSSIENKLPHDLGLRWSLLLERLSAFQSAVVGFSGGVDSGLLCVAAWRALGERMTAVTLRSPVESEGDVASAQRLAAQTGFSLRVIDFDDLEDEAFVANPPDRCYVCKGRRYRFLRDLAAREGYEVVLDGSNFDDLNDYRPGQRAIRESGIVTPLQDAGFGKTEIRDLSKALGLCVWDRPSAPCLATRFPYGSPISRQAIEQISIGERFLRGLGFSSIRIRHYGSLAKIEVAAEEVDRLVSMRQEVLKFFLTAGFKFAAVDLNGYRQGTLNDEVLK